MNGRIKELARQAGFHSSAIIDLGTGTGVEVWHKYDIENDQEDFPTDEMMTKFAELIVRECIDKIETHRIPVGNSAAGEMACEWTYDALKEIRDEIKEHFGVKE